MTDLLELIAISLLPPTYGLHAADRLRRGDSPGRVLTELAAMAARDEPDKVSMLRTRAREARARAAASGIRSIAWTDPE